VQRCSSVICLTGLVLALVVGCSTSDPEPRVPRTSQPPYTEHPETSAPPTPPALGSAPDDLRELDWTHTAVPGGFCDVPGLITFKSGRAWAQSGTWGNIHAEHRPEDVVYGDVIGDSRAEAALLVGCDNGGETAGGRLVWAFLVFTSEKRKLRLVGTIIPQQYLSGQASGFDGIELSFGRVIAHEVWFRENDANCCPTGKATTTWKPGDDGTLQPGSPRITA
jgi:hypothetical protein